MISQTRSLRVRVESTGGRRCADVRGLELTETTLLIRRAVSKEESRTKFGHCRDCEKNEKEHVVRTAELGGRYEKVVPLWDPRIHFLFTNVGFRKCAEDCGSSPTQVLSPRPPEMLPTVWTHPGVMMCGSPSRGVYRPSRTSGLPPGWLKTSLASETISTEDGTEKNPGRYRATSGMEDHTGPAKPPEDRE